LNCRKLKDWFSERYELTALRKLAGEKLVPSHRYDLWYYTGGVTLFLFVLQFITGMLLSLYYIPHAEHAHKSIIEIVTKLNAGWFFRSLHHWGSQLAISALFVHLFAVLLLKSYRKPRELLWFSGFILLVTAIFFGLSGYLLLWDERAFAAVRVATGGAGAFPVVGGFIKAFLRGGIDVTGETLTRFYAFHVAILPLFTIFLLVLHILFVQIHGMSTPLSLKDKNLPQTPFFPNVFYKDIAVWLVALGIVVTMATLFPPEIGRQADPLAAPPENIKPEWYFLFLFQTLKLFPGDILGLNGETIAILLIATGIFLFFLIPLLDRKSCRGEKSTLFTVIGIAYLLYFLIMTLVGYFS